MDRAPCAKVLRWASSSQSCLNNSKADLALRRNGPCSDEAQGGRNGFRAWNVVTLQVKVFQVGPPFGLAFVQGFQGSVGLEAEQEGWVTGPQKALCSHVIL